MFCELVIKISDKVKFLSKYLNEEEEKLFGMHSSQKCANRAKH